MNETDVQQSFQLEAMKRQILNKILTKEAFERLGRIRAANPVLASQLELYLIQVYQSGQMKEQIDDTKMKQILNLLTENKKTKIRRR